MRHGGGEHGQSSVELALCLPVLLLLALAVLQVALVAADLVAVTQAAREAARRAAVDPAPGAALDAARRSTGLDDGALDVDVVHRGRPGDRVTVRVRYRSPTDVPLAGALLGPVHLTATATMQVED